MHNDVPVSWSPPPVGFSGLDRIFELQQNAHSTDAYNFWHNWDRGSGIEYRWERPIALGEWHNVSASYCGANGFSLEVTRLTDGVVTLSEADARANMYVPVDVTSMYVQVMSDGQGKAIDNLRVRRGCGCETW